MQKAIEQMPVAQKYNVNGQGKVMPRNMHSQADTMPKPRIRT
jgi:hypothetical protein